jgi:myo-inositol 2-dehydrogenase/D-chiro-inositol 1-dehydrogenase
MTFRQGESAMKSIPRRTFLSATAGALAVSPLIAAGPRGPNETLGIGLIGVGNRGSVLLQNLLQIPGVEIRVICDVDSKHLETAANVVEKAGRKRPKLSSDGSWKEIIAADGVDGIVSAIPCDLHAKCYLDAIAAGKDLYGEKPMCLTRADLDAVVKAARASKQIVQIGHQRRADPHFIEPINAVHRGEIGNLVEGRILWSNSWGPLYGWFGQRKRSGDWIVEQAVHNWDVLNWAVNAAPVRAMAMGRDDLFRDRQPDRDVHDYYAGVVEYPGNVFVNIVHSWVAPSKFNEEYTRLIGVKGGVDFNSGTFSYRPDLKKSDQQLGGPETNNTLLSLKAFVNSVQTRSEPVCTVEHGRAAVLACLLVRASVDAKAAITMDQVS